MDTGTGTGTGVGVGYQLIILLSPQKTFFSFRLSFLPI